MEKRVVGIDNSRWNKHDNNKMEHDVGDKLKIETTANIRGSSQHGSVVFLEQVSFEIRPVSDIASDISSGIVHPEKEI